MDPSVPSIHHQHMSAYCREPSHHLTNVNTNDSGAGVIFAPLWPPWPLNLPSDAVIRRNDVSRDRPRVAFSVTPFPFPFFTSAASIFTASHLPSRFVSTLSFWSLFWSPCCYEGLTSPESPPHSRLRTRVEIVSHHIGAIDGIK